MARITIAIILVCTFSTTGFGQVPDLSLQRFDSLRENGNINSRSRQINKKIDSLQLKSNQLLNPNLSEDQILSQWKQGRLVTKDSLKAVDDFNAIKASYQHKIDSMTVLNLPTDKYRRKLDSINQISPLEYIHSLQKKTDELEAKANKPIHDLESKINEKLALMNAEGGAAANLPGSAAIKDISLKDATFDQTKNLDLIAPSVGDIEIPEINNPVAVEMEQLIALKERVADVKEIPQQQIDRLKSIDEVQAVEGKVGQANALVDKAQAYQKDAANLMQGNIGELEAIPEAIEQRVAALDEVKELQKQTGEMTKYQDMLAAGNDPEALKSMAKQQAIKYAKDHFAGQEAALMAAMDKLNKVKGKYPAVASLKDLPKRVPNQMKGKPLIERIVPGFQFQIQKSSTLLLDLSPTVGYRICGRFVAGAGWNERLSFSEWNKVVSQDRIYGPRAFTLFNLKKGFSLKAEGERMNTYVPTFTNAAEGHRMWVWSVFVGIQKDYTFFRNVRGTVQMLYNVYDDHGNSPYLDRLNVRMGWEFAVRKQKKEAGL